ncbi:YrzI family small protein [Pseudalkalibacillus berkeleyi]|uniref:YrzI family small protein n=1 Tax=Pseudalkalibacillus berkeleyi TaxID=1069813 RepID=A0ABS9GZB0_9BACL|nr:YrzI family small protein [Pseudalkalibacillus berkeleyi]MCF6138024.1 YrzI family small protein [Pseudalkalibacillus berkeleyi]
MMPMHLFVLTIVQKVLKTETTFEDINKRQQVEKLYNRNRDKAIQYMINM